MPLPTGKVRGVLYYRNREKYCKFGTIRRRFRAVRILRPAIGVRPGSGRSSEQTIVPAQGSLLFDNLRIFGPDI